MAHKLTHRDIEKAMRLYRLWFKNNPSTRNPTDMNTRSKYEFCLSIGYEDYKLMQRCRKTHTQVCGWPHPWTKPEYWELLAGKRKRREANGG